MAKKITKNKEPKGKKDKKKKKKIIPVVQKSQKTISPPNVEDVQLHIIGLTDAKNKQQVEEEKARRRAERILLEGGETTSIDDYEKFISSHKQPPCTHFGYEKPFFSGIFILNKWPMEKVKEYHKREEVPSWINRLIYGRFPNGVLQYLKKRTPILFAYIREDKLFRYLSEEGQEKLDDFIDDMCEMMKEYDNWYDFEKAYCEKYRLPYQPRLI